jgi:hypothetical protein
MTSIIQFPTLPDSPHVEVVFKIRARNAKTFCLIELDHATAEESRTAARRLYAQGYDVTVRRHIIEHIVDWVQDEEGGKDAS